MEQNRREFLDALLVSTVAGGALLGAFPAALAAGNLGVEEAQGGWDTGWGSRLTGRLKTVFDVPEIEGGIPVWRASIWAAQYEAVLRIPARELSTALVLRHNAIALAMRHEFWAKYGIGPAFDAKHPLTGASSDRNVAMLGASDGVGEPYSNFTLDKFLERGGVALACDLALRVLVTPIVERVEGVPTERAYAMAREGLVPGVILQPSGMFAVMRAQEAGAFYFQAS